MIKKILVVEDNPQNRILLRDVLRYYGYEVIEATNGEEGVKMAQAEMPDLVLMDIQMPVMDGMSAGRIIKASPATKDIPVIGLTSYAMKDDRETILGAGFDGYLSKPIDTRHLPQMIEQSLLRRF